MDSVHPPSPLFLLEKDGLKGHNCSMLPLDHLTWNWWFGTLWISWNAGHISEFESTSGEMIVTLANKE